MNYQDSSSDDVPYLPPDQYQNYQEQQRVNRLSQEPSTSGSQDKLDQRRGRSYFTEEELRELDSPSVTGSDSTVNHVPVPTESRIPRPSSSTFPNSNPDLSASRSVDNGDGDGDYAILAAPQPVQVPVPQNVRFSNNADHGPGRDRENFSPKISWGRRLIGILLIAIPAVLFSAAVHFVDWSMTDFQLFSASFFIFQGVLWPCLGILVADNFCVPKNRSQIQKASAPPSSSENGRNKWILAIEVFVHSNLAATAMILQLLSIQRLNISISLALSFGFDVIVILIRFILSTGTCSFELILMTLVSYCGYGVASIPAFVSKDKNTRFDAAVGVGASVGVMLLSVAASLLLSRLRKNQVRDSTLGTTFAFFGCIQSLITKEIMGRELNLQLTGKAVGWAAGLISVVFLGTIFLFLEARLSSLIWKRDDEEDHEDDKTRDGNSLTRTRVAVFILSCLWELGRQGFRDTRPDAYDIFGGFLVVLVFLLAGGFKAWHLQGQKSLSDSPEEEERKPRFCAFVPWLFAQKMGIRARKAKN